MNDGGRGFAGVFANALPDAHHIAAGRVYDLATAILDLLLDRQLGPERGHDHHVVRLKISDVGLLVFPHQVLDAQRGDLLVDLRVVDDLADDEKPAVLENFPRRVSEIDRALDAVTKAE